MDQGTGPVVPRFVDVFGRLVTVTAATKRLLKTLRINNEEFFLRRIYGLFLRIYESHLLRFGSRLQYGVKVLSRNIKKFDEYIEDLVWKIKPVP